VFNGNHVRNRFETGSKWLEKRFVQRKEPRNTRRTRKPKGATDEARMKHRNDPWSIGGRVALGGRPPRAPTDPYVDTLDHTVPRGMVSLLDVGVDDLRRRKRVTLQ
jgi:hypothetical protein